MPPHLDHMLRISTSLSGSHVATLRLEGDLVPPWLRLLEENALVHLQSRRALVLDLAGVRIAGSETARLLERLRRYGPVQIVNCPPLLEQFLGDA